MNAMKRTASQLTDAEVMAFCEKHGMDPTAFNRLCSDAAKTRSLEASTDKQALTNFKEGLKIGDGDEMILAGGDTAMFFKVLQEEAVKKRRAAGTLPMVLAASLVEPERTEQGGLGEGEPPAADGSIDFSQLGVDESALRGLCKTL